MKPRKEDHTRHPTDPHHPQTDTKPSGIRRSLRIKEDIARNQPTAIPNPNLHGGCNRLFVMSRHVIAEPAHEDRLRHVPATGDCVKGEVARSDRNGLLAYQDHVSDCGDDASRQCKGESVA